MIFPNYCILIWITDYFQRKLKLCSKSASNRLHCHKIWRQFISGYPRDRY